MDEILKKYQETITLLQLRHPGITFSGDFAYDDGKIALKLFMYKSSDLGSVKSKVFKFKNTEEMALLSFIKEAQNRVF